MIISREEVALMERFDAVCSASMYSTHSRREFAYASAAKHNVNGGGSAFPADADAIAFVASFHRLSRRLRYAGHELPEYLCCDRLERNAQS
jgi:hypothetical protein